MTQTTDAQALTEQHPHTSSKEQLQLQVQLKRLRHHSMSVKESQPHHATLRRASVMVLLSKDGKMLLNQRSEHLKSHPGEVCFPGGKQDEQDDQDDLTTALRETNEEVGLDIIVELEPLCRLRTLESMNHLCVTPLVGYLDRSSLEISQQLVLNRSEVQAAFWVPLEYFFGDKATTPVEQYDIAWSGETFVFRNYAYREPDHDHDNDNEGRAFSITGLTAHIAHEVAMIAASSEEEITVAPPISSPSVDDQTLLFRGSLWRLQDEMNSRRPYWSRRYFVLKHNNKNNNASSHRVGVGGGGGILHQYDNERHADRKAQTANKKHRLHLNDEDVQVQNVETTDDDNDDNGDEDDNKYAFQISVWNGRIVWQLAAATSKEREEWKARLLLSNHKAAP
jgi:8-oxo-dGTP pyrophosphatase MutT (NUDIX family)